MVGIAMSLGIAVGQFIAGVIGDVLDDWRLPFLLVAAPAMFLGILIMTTITEVLYTSPFNICLLL